MNLISKYKGTMLVALSFFALTASAQKSNVNKASSAVMNENYEKAREYITLALENAETKLQSKTWYYKGRIYEGLVNRADEMSDSTISLMKETVSAYNKSIELNESADYTNSSKEHLNGFAKLMLNKVAPLYESQEYAKAVEVLQLIVSIDGSSANYSYLASAAYSTEQYELAYNSFMRSMELGNLEENTLMNYFSLANGLSKPYAEQEKYLSIALEKYPNNVKFRHNQIQAYEKTEGATIDSVNQQYEEILKIAPNDLIALFNLGAHYFNDAAKLYNAEGDTKATQDVFLKAKGYLEKAYAVAPQDEDVKKVLKKTYTYLHMQDKADKL